MTNTLKIGDKVTWRGVASGLTIIGLDDNEAWVKGTWYGNGPRKAVVPIDEIYADAVPDEPAPSPEPYAYIAKTIGGKERFLSADDAKQYVERDANLEPLYRHPAPSPTKPEGLEWALSEDQFNGVREMIRKAYIAGCNAADMEFGPEDQEPEDFEEPSYEYTTSVTEDFIKLFPSVRLSTVSDAYTVTLSDLSRIEHAFKAIEEYGNQEALDEMAELIEELKAVAATDTVRVKRALITKTIDAVELLADVSPMDALHDKCREIADGLRASFNGGAL